MRIGEFARLIRVPNSRLKSYLEWLSYWGFISDLEFTHGRAEFKITFPPLFTSADLDPEKSNG